MTHEKEINEEIQRDMAEIFEGFKKLIPRHLLETDSAANGDRYGGRYIEKLRRKIKSKPKTRKTT